MEFVDGHEKLTSIFGRWPSFHDAEILALALERTAQFSPTLLLVVHTWEMTDEVDDQGYFVRRHHTRVALRLIGCTGIQIDFAEFNHQNVLWGLAFSRVPGESVESPICVELEPIYGIGGSIRCQRAEVVEAIPCSDSPTGFLYFVEESSSSST